MGLIPSPIPELDCPGAHHWPITEEDLANLQAVLDSVGDIIAAGRRFCEQSAIVEPDPIPCHKTNIISEA